MKTLYLDLSMGAAGDMLSAALLELLPQREAFVERLNTLGIPGVRFTAENSVKCGITGTHMSVTIDGEEEKSADVDLHHAHEHEHHHDPEHEHHHDHGHEHHHTHRHSNLHDIEHIVCGHLNVSDAVKKDILAVYSIIAEAESKVHGKPVGDIHFHEVGTLDAIADIAAVCMLLEELHPDEVIASPIHVGSGQVRCAHGILPVPAPATAAILAGLPIYGGSIKGELCTPTGAALLRHFVTRFDDMPVMKVSAIGYGMGKKDFDAANCIRAMLGETQDLRDTVFELSCNLDDITGEKIGFAIDRIFDAGALDVYTTSIGMKKSRPGILLRAICREDQRDEVVRAIFAHTTTIGIREQRLSRYVLERDVDTVDTPYGPIRVKSARGYGVSRVKPEYDDVSRAAMQSNVSISDIERSIFKAKDKN